MSRRNSRQGKARRRAERDRGQVTERERKRPRTSGQGPRAVEDQAVQAAPRPDGHGPRNSGEHGSGLRSDVGGGLIAVNPGEADLDTDADLENADPGDFGDLDPDDADLLAALAEEDLVEADLGDAGEVGGDLAGDVDGPEVPDGTEDPADSEPGQPSAEADAEADGPGAAGARVVKIAPDGARRGRGDLRLR